MPQRGTGGAGQPLVRGQQQGIKGLRDGDIRSVVGGDVVPQLPDAFQQWHVRGPIQGHRGKISQRLPGASVVPSRAAFRGPVLRLLRPAAK